MHNHKECEHKFKYCGRCNVVYCLKCKNEWLGTGVTITSAATSFNVSDSDTTTMTLDN